MCVLGIEPGWTETRIKEFVHYTIGALANYIVLSSNTRLRDTSSIICVLKYPTWVVEYLEIFTVA